MHNNNVLPPSLYHAKCRWKDIIGTLKLIMRSVQNILGDLGKPSGEQVL